jgi:hypothetical protein
VLVNRAQDFEDLIPDLDLSDVLRQRPIGLVSVRHVVRVTIAVTVSMVIATALSKSTLGIFAPITTLLVVQASPWSTLGVSVQRILGTGIGVLVASLWVNLVGLTWWSFLIGVLASLLVARALPWSLGGQMQIPVAVIFVLAIGPGSLDADLWRVVDVIIGGVVGLIAVFIYPPRPHPEVFEAALGGYRDGIVDTMTAVGSESGVAGSPMPPDDMHAYVITSRRLRNLSDQARADLVHLVEASHWNLRAGHARSGVEDRAVRLRRLNGIGLQVRGIVGAANRMYDRDGSEPLVSADRLRELTDHQVRLMRVTLGVEGQPVRGVDRSEAERLDGELMQRLRAAAADIDALRGPTDALLPAMALLGRLDHVRLQLADFPGWSEDEEA